MKKAQYEADLASHKRLAAMKELQAANARYLQETEWKEMLEWEAQMTAEALEARSAADRHFKDQRDMHNASAEEMRQLQSYLAEKVKYEMEASRAGACAAISRPIPRPLWAYVHMPCHDLALRLLTQRSVGSIPGAHRANGGGDGGGGGGATRRAGGGAPDRAQRADAQGGG